MCLISLINHRTEPRASSLLPAIIGRWYSGHAALGVWWEVYPGWYGGRCVYHGGYP